MSPRLPSPLASFTRLCAAGCCAVALAAPVPAGEAQARDPAAMPAWPPLRVFDSAGGLPQNSVLALAQDAAGYLHAGTGLGPARYDGAGWEPVRLGADGRVDAVGALAALADGSVLVGTAASGLYRLAPGSLQAAPVPGSAGRSIFRIVAAGADTALVAARGGVLRCAPDACTPVGLLDGETVRSLLLEGAGAEAVLWVGTDRRGLRRVDGIGGDAPRWSPFALTRADGLPNDVVIALHRTRHAGGAQLWIGTGRGVARWDGSRLTAWSAADGLPSAMAWAFADGVDPDGRSLVYVALRPGGVLEIADDDRWRLLGTAAGLPDGAAQSLLRDRGRGNLWIGTVSGGLARTEPGRWATLDERAGLPDRNIVGVGFLTDASGRTRLWVGTARGAVVHTGRGFEPLLPEPHRGRRVHGVADLGDGTRWVATERGLLVLDGGRLRAEYTVDNSALPAVWANELARWRAPDGQIALAIATGHGLARWRADRGLERWALPGAGAADGPVRALAVQPARDGGADTLWVAQGDALLAVRGEHVAVHSGCSAGATVEDLDADAETVWVLTRDALHAIDADGDCSAVDPPAGGSGYTHVAVSTRTVHVFGAQGAWRRARAGGSWQHDDLADGLPARELSQGPTVAIAADGRVHAGTVAGLATWAPETVPAAAQAPALILDAFLESAPERPLAAGARVPAAAADLGFRWRLLDFAREHRIRYRVQLEGLDAQPRDWSARSAMAFPRLPPGDYRLAVWARDADGREHGPAVHPFTVVAPAWQRPWAFAGYALALLLAGALYGRWRVQRIRRRAAALEAEVRTRTRELAEANARLAEAAVTDPLTGLRNRRFLMLELAEETERCLRRIGAGHADGDLMLVLLDIDRFKAINDTHGHAAGDAVLVAVAERLRTLVREGDFALRWGGEEFLLVLRDFDRREAETVVPRLLAGVAGPVTLPDGAVVALTVSAGAVAFPPDRGAPRAHGFEATLAIADAAMYRAKQGGRDRAVLVRRVSHPAAPHAGPAFEDVVLLRPAAAAAD